jgi:GTPase SAR1 family protein
MSRRLARWRKLANRFAERRPHPRLVALLLTDIRLALQLRESRLEALVHGHRSRGKFDDVNELTMHTHNILAAREEVLRLLSYTDTILDRHLTTPDLLREADGQQRHLDRTTAQTWKGVLQTELAKVQNLEAVVAVVGAAKAGKSTTINAIVGAEVLPNRAKPMTTYPTLVRHTPGQRQPLLRFPLAREFAAFVALLRERLADLETQKPLDQWLWDPIDVSIANRVRGGLLAQVLQEYSGPQSIADFLEAVNDICRLSSAEAVSIDIPNAAGETLRDIPSIDVEFHHVRQPAVSVGRLLILDLPGPNEALHGTRLRRIVTKQLLHASAVILVCDCTQDRTEAAHELQGMVLGALPGLKDRLFVFANKIDQLGPKESEPATLKQDYAKTLLGGAVSADRVFPLAARRGFLANWALREIDAERGLSDHSAGGLAMEFGRIAFGVMWRDQLGDPNAVTKAAKLIWRDCGLDEPLEKVVAAAASSAALISLASAADKILRCNRDIDGFLRLREGVATHDAQALLDHVQGLRQDIDSVRAAHVSVSGMLGALVPEFRHFVNGVCQGIADDLDDLIRTHLASTPEAARTRTKRPRRRGIADRVSETLKSFRDEIVTMLQGGDAGAVIKLHIPAGQQNDALQTLEFRGEAGQRDADEFLRKVNEGLSELFTNGHRAAQDAVNGEAEVIEARVNVEIVGRLAGVLKAAEERLAKAFNVKFDASALRFGAFAAGAIGGEGAVIERRLEQWTQYEAREGVVARVQRWIGAVFDSKWGYDYRTVSEEIVSINVDALRRGASEQLRQFEHQLKGQSATFVEEELQQRVTLYFGNLVDYLEQFKGDLVDAWKDTDLEAARIEALLATVRELRHAVDSLLIDSKAMVAALETDDV